MSGALSTEDFKAALRAGSTLDGATVVRFSDTQPQATADRDFRYCFNEELTDLANDVIRANAWKDLTGYIRNPVVLWSHDAMTPPIGRAKDVGVTGKRLMGTVQFADAATSEFADQIFRLVKGGFLRGCSVGFKPVRWALATDKARPGGIDFNEVRLLELSVCGVPCHPNSLVQARSAGLDTRLLKAWAEKVLDGEGETSLHRRQLESLHSQASDREARMAHAASLKREFAEPKPETREERVAHANALKAKFEREAETPAQRIAHARALRRKLEADGYL